MRETVAVAFMLLAASSIAVAQSPAPSTNAGSSAATPSRDEAKPPTAASGDEAADARRCLEFPTNLEVIRCAERYRHPKRKG
jgi:hypothetical protein